MTKVLLIYTGGTIGMVRNRHTNALENFNFDRLLDNVPELVNFDLDIQTYSFDPPIDSSDMGLEHWSKLGRIIESRYDIFDGFVVLHGTDTMAYTASALSFMFENLSKPIILTGSQLPIGTLRTDGKENLITAIEMAAAKNEQGDARCPEVCIYFKEKLLRGNRTTKINAEQFNAFKSFNYPELAKAGINITWNDPAIRKSDKGKRLRTHYAFDPSVVVLTLYPGIQQSMVHAVLNIPDIKAVVLRTFGAGNAPQLEWLKKELKDANNRGILVVNITQCQSGSVHMGLYETSLPLLEVGVVSGYDCTPECAITKLMFLLGRNLPIEQLHELMTTSIAGEITRYDE